MNSRSPVTNLSPLPCFRSIVALLLGVSVLLSGCTTLRSVPVPAPGQPQTVAVKIGDKAQAQLKSGGYLIIQVTAIEADALVGKDVQTGQEARVKYEDMSGLQIKRVDKVRTTAAVAGTAVGIYVVAAVAVAAALGSLMGGL